MPTRASRQEEIFRYYEGLDEFYYEGEELDLDDIDQKNKFINGSKLIFQGGRFVADNRVYIDQLSTEKLTNLGDVQAENATQGHSLFYDEKNKTWMNKKPFSIHRLCEIDDIEEKNKNAR